jgi:hypothetical protein
VLRSLGHPRVGRELHPGPRIFRDLLSAVAAAEIRELTRTRIHPFPNKAKVVRHDRLGGLLKSYSRKAA